MTEGRPGGRSVIIGNEDSLAVNEGFAELRHMPNNPTCALPIHLGTGKPNGVPGHKKRLHSVVHPSTHRKGCCTFRLLPRTCRRFARLFQRTGRSSSPSGQVSNAQLMGDGCHIVERPTTAPDDCGRRRRHTENLCLSLCNLKETPMKAFVKRFAKDTSGGRCQPSCLDSR